VDKGVHKGPNHRYAMRLRDSGMAGHHVGPASGTFSSIQATSHQDLRKARNHAAQAP